MSTKRVQQYKGFTLEVTYLPHYPDVEVIATRDEYPALAIFCTDLKEARARIDRYWKEKETGRQAK